MFNTNKFFGINFIVILTFLGGAFNTTPIKEDALLQSPDPIHFAVIGDYGIAGQPELDVANIVKSWNPEFIITTGDNNYPAGSASTIDQNIGQYYHDYIYPYTGSYGPGAVTNQFFPTLGNHDWDVVNAQPYLDYFALPGNERYYDFVKGSVHFFAIDSDSDEPDGSTSASTQALWLQSRLAASTSVWNIVFLHHAPFSSDQQTARLQWPFAAWGADAILAGHSHTYERIFQNGIPYFVNGLGGDSKSTFGTPVSGSQVRYNGDYGAMLVDASEAEITFQFITRTGMVIDSYTLPATTPPTVSSIVRANANPTAATSVDFTVTFSEGVTGVNTAAPFSDFSLTTSSGISGASVTGVSGSGATYTVTVNTGSGNGTIRLDLVDIDNILDYVGNKLGGTGLGNGDFNGGETYTLDKTAPTVSSITRASANPTVASNVDFTVTFSEDVTGVDTTAPFSDFALTTSPSVNGASVTGVSGSGTTYTVTVNTGSGNGMIRLDVSAISNITDLIGNQLGNLPYTGGETYTIDKIVPAVSSIHRVGSNPTSASSVNFTVTFSESVTGVNMTGPAFDDFTLTTSPGITGAAVTGVSGTGATYTVTVNTGTGDGTIRLDVIDDDTILDGAGNPLGGAGINNGNFTSGEVYKIHKSGGDTVGVFRPSTAAFYLRNANSAGAPNITVKFGAPGDYPVVGDWDGNGTDTIGVYRNGVFYLSNSNTSPSVALTFAFGKAGDQPIAGDWNGDGKDTIGVYRSSAITFLLRNTNSAGAADATFKLGSAGDVGIAGDWNADGMDTTGVFRPSNGALYLKNANTSGFADVRINYGTTGDKPVTGDWNNDLVATIGVFRKGTFYLRNTNTIGYADFKFAFGATTDMPVAGNWDGIP